MTEVFPTVPVSWDAAVAETREKLKDALLELVSFGVIYVDDRGFWHHHTEERDPQGGHFPYVGGSSDELLDQLMLTGVIELNHERTSLGLTPACRVG